MEITDSVPSSVSVGTMSYSEVSSWITRLIGSFGGCVSLGSRRNVLRKYLQKQEAGTSVQPPPLSSEVENMPFEDVSMLIIDQIGSFAECKDERSQRDLLKTYLHKKELKGQGRLSDVIHLNNDYEVEHGSDIVKESSDTQTTDDYENPPEPVGGSTGIKAIAIYDYEPPDDDDDKLTLDADDIITNIEMIDEGWWRGECGGKVGLFPANYVEIVQE